MDKDTVPGRAVDLPKVAEDASNRTRPRNPAPCLPFSLVLFPFCPDILYVFTYVLPVGYLLLSFGINFYFLLE